ncbi:VWA domain-containing protein [Diaphorobacter sp. HDW4A]|uniref:vWA domain-containing protein n=1 Tax=Diaphorobacter sp. HDW4A TaxID=2714924 RepID=UPI001408AED3|nr:VWA domain-containing protein [Diaphorobacter sp. HDW4A]QIL81065.1 VWA domain-containing protein [Diaphorobacter sp. HDW4A]
MNTTHASPLGDARSGKLPEQIFALGRALRRAGVPLDSARMATACDAAQLVGIERKPDLQAALQSVLISREQDRAVFSELFDAMFRNPDIANKLLSQMLPHTETRPEPAQRKPRVSEALAPPRPQTKSEPVKEDKLQFDAAMTASDNERLKHADFNALSASEFKLVERLARDIALPIPTYATRRMQPAARGHRPHWSGAMREAMRTGGEPLRLPRLQRQRKPLPLLVLVDVSGSMERYARLLLAFLHAATRAVNGRNVRRDVFAFGTGLSDLTPAFALGDPDAMLTTCNALIADFGGGTRLGDSLAALRQHHARRLTGRRTLVLLISDGLDTGEPAQLALELGWLQRHSRALLWLNPLLRYEGYAPLARGASQLHARADAMLAVHNLQSLHDLADSLARLLSLPRLE